MFDLQEHIQTVSSLVLGITEEIKSWSHLVAELFSCLHNGAEPAEVTSGIDGVREKLQTITAMIHDLSKKTDGTEIIADIIETELSSMDKAIEEASLSIEKLLSQSRASDSGIKLEVNEKILDACTALMNSIRILVQKSRALQAEIVALGRGLIPFRNNFEFIVKSCFVCCRFGVCQRILQAQPSMD